MEKESLLDLNLKFKEQFYRFCKNPVLGLAGMELLGFGAAPVLIKL